MSDAKPPDCELALNSNLDWDGLSKAFSATGRLHIDKLLTEAAAKRLHYALVHETPWRLVFNEGNKWNEYNSVSTDVRQEMTLAAAAWRRAHSQFQYFYRKYQLSEGGKIYPDSRHYLFKLVSFFNSTQFLSFVHTVTGMKAIDSVSSAATLYKPLDFLTMHNDHGAHADDRRLVAYVLNLTPDWWPDWGGALQFYNEDRNQLLEAYLPTFNALNLFRVPMWHSVAQVTPFGEMRYAVSGWLEHRPE